MENVILKRDGDKLLVEVDLSQNAGPSASGKTVIVASTRGNAAVPGCDDTFIGLNIFRYASGKKGKASR